ncbi:ABC transporter substrate-binding protein [Ectothiorhodospira mobilis]|uniref:ABC transporter substrate-binding protein n=1 Tax=Ectothiorhodospira mobilis TaxID=195064 RepID=UPI001EE7C701|nr:ABC transporter substrate-binding protein [Ectothiorhodospira mobilis]MCG5536152.1 ABC transporter substrate-binding protein [Ectothiorhodospira mobilis]
MHLPKRLLTLSLAGLVLFSAAPSALASEPARVRFSAPPWPGVTVKTALASLLLETLGYEPRLQELSSNITYKAMLQNDLDVFMAAWLPAQQGMYEASFREGEQRLMDLGNNVDGARLGFAVPAFVFDAGLHSAEDLDDPRFADRLDRTIYSIEIGSGMSDTLNAAVEKDTYGLGDWTLSETSTPGMLSAVDHAMDQGEWIVFGAWTPHWMNIEYDIRYLEDPQDMWGPDGGHSDVRTLVTRAFAESHPNATRLLDQLTFTAADQSIMIRGFSFEEREPEAVALEWLRDHPARVRAFLDGVTTRDGAPAWPVVQRILQLPDD